MGCKLCISHIYQSQTLFCGNKATHTPLLLQRGLQLNVLCKRVYIDQNFTGITKRGLSPNFFEEYYPLITFQPHLIFHESVRDSILNLLT